LVLLWCQTQVCLDAFNLGVSNVGSVDIGEYYRPVSMTSPFSMQAVLCHL
jgi:hypothetical protein